MEGGMSRKHFAFAFISMLAISHWPAGAQEVRTSTVEPDTSLTFNRYFEPFARVDTPQACRDICLKDRRCTGWTYYHPSFVGSGPRETWETLLRTCVIGAGLKHRWSGDARGRTAGEIRSRPGGV
jgi:hypothetical protein